MIKKTGKAPALVLRKEVIVVLRDLGLRQVVGGVDTEPGTSVLIGCSTKPPLK